MKQFSFEGHEFSINEPEKMRFENDFFETVYIKLFQLIIDGRCEPHVDCDELSDQGLGDSFYDLAEDNNLRIGSPSSKSSNPVREKCQIAIQLFCTQYPAFVTFIQNCRFKANIAIRHAEFIANENCNIDNFIKLKRICGQFNEQNWTRQKDTSEANAAVSNLGTISEDLLKNAFGGLTDDSSFIKVTNPNVNSYGDFVLTCLPNNLWLSVKSNFARERLLASGYSNDILAVGFFEDFREFTSRVRVRNMSKAGFLAVYIPDVPVTSQQVSQGQNTYGETLKYFEGLKLDLPLNINGTQFFRPLSSIADDLSALLNEKDLSKRLSINF